MEPYIELAIERWAREYNEKHDRELRDLKRKRLPFTHPHLFRGDPFKATTSRQILARTRAIEEGNTEDVLKMRATLKAEAANEELEKRSDDA